MRSRIFNLGMMSGMSVPRLRRAGVIGTTLLAALLLSACASTNVQVANADAEQLAPVQSGNVQTTALPPIGPNGEVQSAAQLNPPAKDGAAPTLALDSLGNAKGGIRTPWVDAPTARLSGFGNTGGPFGFLVGTTEPFDAARLKRLYPGGRDDYLKHFDAALARSVKAGFIRPADEAEIRALAAATYPGG